MRIAFTGGRNYQNRAMVRSIMDLLSVVVATPIEVSVGDALGADSLVEEEADRVNFAVTKNIADWNKLGKAAGPIRNAKIIDGASVLIAFPGGGGTANCVAQASTIGVPVIRIPV